MDKSTIEQTREERRTVAARQINATLADLVDIAHHGEARQRLLAIVARATGYTYALQSEMELDGQNVRVMAAYFPSRLYQTIEKLFGFTIVGGRFNDTAMVLHKPPTQLFTHIDQWLPDVTNSAALAIEALMGLHQIACIHLHTGEHYLGTAHFLATTENHDLPLLEYLCHNHLVYAIRLIQEQAASAHLNAMRANDFERIIVEYKKAVEARRACEAAIRSLYAVNANQQMTFTERVQTLLKAGQQYFGMQIGILSHIVGDDYWVMEANDPTQMIRKGDLFPLRLICLILLPLLTIINQDRAIEMQKPQGEGAGFTQRLQSSVIEFQKMQRKRLATWIPQVWISGSFGPVITFIMIAGKTAVDKVIERISTTFNTRLKMINRQFVTCIGFVNEAVLTAKICSLPHKLTGACIDSHLNKDIRCVRQVAEVQAWSTDGVVVQSPGATGHFHP